MKTKKDEIYMITLVPYCIYVAVRQYLKERHFYFFKVECKNIKWALEAEFEENNISNKIKNIDVKFKEKENTISIKVDYEYNSIPETSRVTYSITELKEEHEKNYKELEEITVQGNGKIRFAGNFVCNTVTKTDDLTDLGVYDNKYESNMRDIKVYYEGDLKDGKPDGEGKLVWYNGKVLYEGEFVDGKVTGKGKGYFLSGKISAEGYWLNGKLEGKATQYYENGNIEYTGEYKDGFSDGFGSSYYPDGKLLFEGMWEDAWNLGPIIKYSKNGTCFMYDNEKFYLVKPNGDKIKEISEKELDKLIAEVEAI